MAVFRVRRSSDEQFYFVALARSGRPLIQSGSYPTRQAAEQAVDTCRAASADEAHYQRHQSSRNKHYFDITDRSNAYLATSAVFDTAHRRDDIIEYCLKRLPTAKLTDEEVPAATD
ncbi:MAG: DUF1508 domain-containing protein [Phycisphaerales bacterium]|nr:DUF1508 domain-containing protein [Phycisphaerales bacterium]